MASDKSLWTHLFTKWACSFDRFIQCSGSALDLFSGASGIRIPSADPGSSSSIFMFQFQQEVASTYTRVYARKLNFKIVFENIKGFSSKLFLLWNLREDLCCGSVWLFPDLDPTLQFFWNRIRILALKNRSNSTRPGKKQDNCLCHMRHLCPRFSKDKNYHLKCQEGQHEEGLREGGLQ